MSVGGHDCYFTSEQDLGNRRFLEFSLVLGIFVLPTLPTVRVIFKDAALGEQRTVETTDSLCD